MDQQAPQTPGPQYTPQQQSSGKAITSMVTGICSLVLCFSYGILGLPCAIVAIVFAKKARNAVAAGDAPESSLGMAKAGAVCGWVGIVLNSLALIYLIFMILIAVGVVAAGAAGAASNPTLLPFGLLPF
tara:strand:- start:110582 stop:110968 length:387 start_codon:yes stop_codon:yes gene_type:complete